jgi:F0F1-type ATP synthase assembly protein I
LEQNQQNNEPEPKKEPLKNYMKYSGIAVQMIVIIGLGAWAGIKLDEHFEFKTPVFTICLLLFSVVASMYYVIRSLMR